MCATVFVVTAGRAPIACETQGQLRAIAGNLAYVINAPSGAKNDDAGCLCWVDVPAVAQRMHYQCEHDGADYTLSR